MQDATNLVNSYTHGSELGVVSNPQGGAWTNNVDRTNYHQDEFMLPNEAPMDLGGSSSTPAFSTNPIYRLIYPTVGNSVGSTNQYPQYNYGNPSEITPYGFGDASGSRVEHDQGSDDEEKYASIFRNMSRDNYGRGKSSWIDYFSVLLSL